EWERGDAFAQVRSCNLARLHRLSGAVEAVVHDLEGDPERETELAELAAAARDQARGLEQLRSLQRAACQVLVDGRVGAPPLAAFHGLSADERIGGVREDRDGPRVPRRGKLGERTREQVDASGSS